MAHTSAGLRGCAENGVLLSDGNGDGKVDSPSNWAFNNDRRNYCYWWGGGGGMLIL